MALLESTHKPEPPKSYIGTGRYVSVNGVQVYQPPKTTVSFRPSGGGSRTVTRTIAQPVKQKMTYSEAGIPEEQQTQEPNMPLSSAISSRVADKKKYVQDIKDYNQSVTEYNAKIKKAKEEVDNYNKEVEKWNTKGRFQKQTTTITEPTSYKVTVASTQSDKGKTSPMTPQGLTFLNKFNQQQDAGKTSPITSSGQYWIDSTNKLLEKKPTLGGELKSQFTNVFWTQPKKLGYDLGLGFGTLVESVKSGKALYREPFRKGVSEFKSGFEMSKQDTKDFIKTQPFRKGFISESLLQARQKKEDILYNPQRQAEDILNLGGYFIGVKSSNVLNRALTPKIEQKPQLKIITETIETPAGLKGMVKSDITVAKIFTTEPQITSRFSGALKSNTYYSGSYVSYEPVLNNQSIGGNFYSKSTAKPLQLTGQPTLPEPQQFTLLTSDTTKGFKYPNSVINRDFKFISNEPRVTSLAVVNEIPNIDITFTKGSITAKSFLNTKTTPFTDVSISVVKRTPVRNGVTLFESTEVFNPRSTSKILSIEPSLIKDNLIEKIGNDFYVTKSNKSPYYDVKQYFIGETDSAKIIGANIQTKDLILKSAKPTPNNFKRVGSIDLLSNTSETARLYPVGLPEYKPVLLKDTTAFSLLGITKADRLQRLSLFNANERSRPSLNLKSDEYLATLGTGLTPSERNKYNLSVNKQSTRLQTGNYSQQELKMQFEKPLKTVNINLVKPKNITTNISKSNILSNGMILQMENPKNSTLRSEIRNKLSNQNIYAPNFKSYIVENKYFTEAYNLNDNKNKYYNEIRNLNINKNIIKNENKTTPKNRNIIFNILQTSQITRQEQISAQQQAQENEMRNYNEQEFNRPNPRFNLPIRTGGLVVFPRIKPDNKQGGNLETQSYDTYVLDKKQWVKANKGNERNNYYGALQLGSEVADNSSARSFKLKRASGTANRIYPYQPSLIKFYQPSKQGNPKLTTAYIEKSKYLIDTQGERQDISAKGYMKQRKFRGF